MLPEQRPGALCALLAGGDGDTLQRLECLLPPPFTARTANTLLAFTDALRSSPPSLILVAGPLADATLPELLHSLRARHGATPFIVCAPDLSESLACELLRAGATAVFAPHETGRLIALLERLNATLPTAPEARSALEADRFSALHDNIPGVLFQLHQRHDRSSAEFTFVSGASQMLLDVSAEVLVARRASLLQFVVPAERAGLLEALADARRQNRPLNWEGRIAPPGGVSKWINIRCSPRPQPGRAVLWEGVMWNITHSRLTETELRASRAQLAELSEHLQRVKEEERERIARDIHDVLGGTLVGIKISVKFLAEQLRHHDADVRDQIYDIETMLDDAITTAGRVARELRPGILKEFGLPAAIESYADDYSHRAGIACRVLCADYDIEADDDTALALFRTYQEALTNVSKHAGASQVEIRLTQEGDEIVLEVSDDGRGIVEQDLRKPRSFGLRSIRERLNGLGGSMQLAPCSPRGTRVILRAPVAAQANGHVRPGEARLPGAESAS
ncbi:MAG: sensor histidine kinase [Candidatus Dactylopiibacterium sp.]|nr:sensor histidine kinase [Candidatus Dactylopiibacterium sp.]